MSRRRRRRPSELVVGGVALLITLQLLGWTLRLMVVPLVNIVRQRIGESEKQRIRESE